MGAQTVQSSRIWALAARQRGVVSRRQLVAHGLTGKAIRHRIARGRLHQLYRGVYAVGRRELTRHGRWMAAVLACGEGALLSHSSAAALYGIAPERTGEIEISVVANRQPRHEGLRVHRRAAIDSSTYEGIPVTAPTRTLLDLATRTSERHLEAAVNNADNLSLIDPEATFTLTDSELERRFLPIARKAGLPTACATTAPLPSNPEIGHATRRIRRLA